MPAISSKEYWEKRSELNLIQNEKSASQYERQLKKAYEETIRSIRKEVQAFYQRHSDETGVTLTSARRRLKPDEQMDFQKQARKYLAEVERLGDKAFTAEYRGYLKKLSGRAYISQMDELVTNIRHNIETLSTGYNEGLGNTLKDAYEDGYYRTMFDAQKRAGVGVSFTTPGGKQLETAIREKWLGQNYSDRIWTDKKKLTDNIEQMLSQEFVRGRGPNEIARDFADRLNVSYSNAQRLIRTEINYISNKGSLQAYKDTGIVEKYRYLATLDSRTSDICRELDGEVFEIKEAKVGVNLPPLHPYCRSTTVPHFDDDDIGELIEDRIARDGDGTVNSIRLGENLKFFDWVEKYGSESFKKRVAAQRKRFLGMDKKPKIPSNPTFGEPGNYHVYRAGSLETRRGIISFSIGKELADSYADLPAHAGTGGTKEYVIEIKKPLLIQATMSMGATQAAHKKLFGKGFDNGKPNAQRNADKRIAKEMERQGYDALMLKIDYYGKNTPEKYEILVPNKYKKNINIK